MKSQVRYTFLKDFNRPSNSSLPESMKHIPAGTVCEGWYEFQSRTHISSDLIFYLIQFGVIKKETI